MLGTGWDVGIIWNMMAEQNLKIKYMIETSRNVSIQVVIALSRA